MIGLFHGPTILDGRTVAFDRGVAPHRYKMMATIRERGWGLTFLGRFFIGVIRQTKQIHDHSCYDHEERGEFVPETGIDARTCPTCVQTQSEMRISKIGKDYLREELAKAKAELETLRPLVREAGVALETIAVLQPFPTETKLWKIAQKIAALDRPAAQEAASE